MPASDGTSHHPAESSAFAYAMEPVARELLGEPSKEHRGKREARWGTRGSFSVNFRKGIWHDHETGKGGGVLALVMHRNKLNKPEAIGWLQDRGHGPRDTSAEPGSRRQVSSRRQVTSYRYTDEAGVLLFEVVRFEPKDFRQRRPDGNGGWVWTMAGVPLVPYRLPELVAAVRARRTVFVVEGEKGADGLKGLDLFATCSPGGANKWRAEYGTHFADAHVVILPDNDEPGRSHARMVAEALHGVASTVQILELPDLPPKGDVVDWIEAGGTAAVLEELVRIAREREPGPALDTPLPLLWFDAIAPVLDAKDFIQGVLAEGGAAVVYGDTNAGKTFWVTDLALHVAAGKPWNGRRVDGGGVIYCALEGGNGFRNRVSAWRMANPMPGRQVPFAAIPASLNLLDPDADTPGLIATIQMAAKRMGQPVRLVVIDTLSRAMAGGNENASDDMGALVRNMDTIRSATGACVLFVHHSGKDAAKGARGHSLLRAAMDTEIEVRADDEASIRSATVVKQRELSKGAVFGFRLDVTVLGENQHGEDVTTCTVAATEPVGVKSTRNRRTLTAAQSSWLQDLTDMFAVPDAAALRVPVEGMTPCPTLTRDQVRAGLRVRGRFALGPDANLTGADRERLRSTLNALKDMAKIGLSDKLVWLLDRRQATSDMRQA